MIVNSKEYAEIVEDALCEKFLLAVYDVADQANREFGNMTGVDLRFGACETVGYDDSVHESYLIQMRDIAIAWLEEMGFDVQPDDTDF